MIYGKLSLKDWRTARVEGETPESSFESYNFRLFFFGTLYNRDQLQSSPADSNAKLVADAYLADSNYGFSRLRIILFTALRKEISQVLGPILRSNRESLSATIPVHRAFSSGADFCHRDLVLWPTPHFWVEESSFTCLRKTDL